MSVEYVAPHDSYENDLVAWSERQAVLARTRKTHLLDLLNLAEELEETGRRERRALESQLTRLIMHLLKWKYRPERRSGSWHLTIRDARRNIERILRDSPSLASHLDAVFDECYANARGDAAAETRLPLELFPGTAPFAQQEMLDSDFLPD